MPAVHLGDGCPASDTPVLLDGFPNRIVHHVLNLLDSNHGPVRSPAHRLEILCELHAADRNGRHGKMEVRLSRQLKAVQMDGGVEGAQAVRAMRDLLPDKATVLGIPAMSDLVRRQRELEERVVELSAKVG